MSETASLLVADDDRLILATLASGLRNAGYQVLPAASGAEAVRLGVRERPALALLDIRLPDLSGLEVAQRLREDADVPSLFLSAYHDAELVAEATERGALGYLVKPIDVPQIIPAIKAALTRAAEIYALRRNQASLNQALTQGREVSVAVGILIERLHSTEAEAFAALRAYARAHRRKLAEVAAELVQATEQLYGLSEAIGAHRSKAEALAGRRH